MKRKFYLRGLGIGILVTAVIMGIASGRKRDMTDEEIRERARELGMVESVVLSNLETASPSAGSAAPSQPPVIPETSPEVTPSEETPAEESPSEETPSGETPMGSPEASPEESPSGETPMGSPEASPEETPSGETPMSSPEASPAETLPEETPETTAAPDGTVWITIRSGQSSAAVSRLLEEAGLVGSASAYDKYLCENGYDNRIRSGTHEIPAGAGEEEIALIITGNAGK